jgi:type I restriction enzyme S subunit
LARKGNTVIIASNGNAERVGNCAYIDTPNEFCIASFLISLEVKNPKEMDSRYLYHLVGSPIFQGKITKNVQGSTGLNNINVDSLLSETVPIHHISFQPSVASFIDAIDCVSKTQKESVEQSCRTRAALMQQLLLPTPKTQSKFKLRSLGELFAERKESGQAGLPTLSVTMYDGIVDREEHGRRVASELSPEEHLLARKHDIAYNMMRMWQGVSGLAPYDGLVSPAYVVLQPKPGIDPLFASYLFKLPETIRLFHRYSQGLTNDRLRLYYDQFAEIRVPIPIDVAEQKRIAHLLSTFDQHIEQSEVLVTALRQTKAAICQKLFS